MISSAAQAGFLAWPDDWDGEGSPGYLLATWLRAETFLARFNAGPWPVQAGPEGSIDIYWTTPRELLVNVPVAATEPIGFFGQDADSTVKGETFVTPHWLVAWLQRPGEPHPSDGHTAQEVTE